MFLRLCSEESGHKNLVGESRVGWLQIYKVKELLQMYQGVLYVAYTQPAEVEIIQFIIGLLCLELI